MKKTTVSLALFGALLAVGSQLAQAAAPDWSKVPSRTVQVFHAGVTPVEWVMKKSDHSGRTGINKGDASRIAKTAKALREADLEVNCPPSTTLLVAQMATFGVEARITFQMNLVNKIEDIEKRRAVEELLNRELGMTFDDALAKTAIAKVF